MSMATTGNPIVDAQIRNDVWKPKGRKPNIPPLGSYDGPGFKPDPVTDDAALLNVEALLAQARYYEAIAGCTTWQGRHRFYRAALALRFTAAMVAKHGTNIVKREVR